MIEKKTQAWIGGTLVLLGIGLFGACKTEEKLPRLGDKIAGPVDVATSPSGNYFYALNSDYERRFAEGSLLVIDPETTPPTKVAAIPIERLARSMDVAQNLMLITYDATYNDEKDRETTPRRVELWDLKDEKNPVAVASWMVPCAPINGVLAPSQPYFVVSCLTGDIYMGHVNRSDLAASTLDRARSYGYAHRALYFYENGANTKLVGFPTDMDVPNIDDAPSVDKITYDRLTDSLIDGADEVPDSMQNTLSVRRHPENGFPYQMFIYDVTSEETASAAEGTGVHFRYLELGDFAKPSLANQEMRFVYFNLRDQDGTPANGEGTVDIDQRYYRTNFYHAKAGQSSVPEVFYLSQRGNSYGSSSNNVLRVEINPTALNSTTAKFSDIFKIDRVYGFTNDRDSTGRYPNSFTYAELDGEPMLLVNHFRDLINFRDAPFYGISRKFLNLPYSAQQAESTDSTDYHASYYQLAVSKSGKLLTCSYYGESLYLFDARPRNSMRNQTPIRIE